MKVQFIKKVYAAKKQTTDSLSITPCIKPHLFKHHTVDS